MRARRNSLDFLRDQWGHVKRRSGWASRVGIIILVVTAAGAWFLWQRVVRPRLDADHLEGDVAAYAEVISRARLPLVDRGQMPYRTGRVVVVAPPTYVSQLASTLPPRIHDAYYQLDRTTRATKPEEVATVITVERQFQFRRSAVFDRKGAPPPETKAAGSEELKVFTWPGKIFIGTWSFAPGDHNPVVTGKGMKAMEEAIDPEVIAAFIEKMPVKSDPGG